MDCGLWSEIFIYFYVNLTVPDEENFKCDTDVDHM